MKRVGRFLSTIVALATGLSLLLVSPAGAANPNKVGPPNSMAAAGDSITRAFNAGVWPFTESPGRSWSTGVDRHVRSHYRRILAAEPAIRDKNHNLSVSGSKVSDLVDQMSAVNARRVAYVTILIGANDLCTRTVGSMTSVEDFESRFEEAMALLSAGSPRARTYVVSIPNIKRLWFLFKDDFLARTAWRLLGVCRSLLARPRSTDPEDVERRDAFKERNRAFNRVLADVCQRYVHCRFDGRAVFRDRFSRDEVSGRDYFHPSRDGQRRLARVSWSATFDFTDRIAPTSEAQTVLILDGTLVTLVATDDVGVAGIEYRINRGPFRRYESPLVLEAGTELRFRAVDVNGNIEETHILTV